MVLLTLRRFDYSLTGKFGVTAIWSFYGQPRNEDGSISFSAEGTNSVFTVDLSRLKPDVQKVAFTVTCDGSHTVSSLNHLSIQIESGNTSLISGQVELSGRQEAALILGEVYRRNGDWKFRFIARGLQWRPETSR